MRRAVFYAMAVSLLRDRGALLLTFLLPPLVFAVFATIFSAAARGDLEVSIAYVSDGTEQTDFLLERMQSSPSVTGLTAVESKGVLSDFVRRGVVDVGVEFIARTETDPPKYHIYLEQSRIGAAALTEAVLMQARAPQSALLRDDFVRVVVAGDEKAPPMAAYYAAGVAMLFLFLSGLQGALSLIEERDSGIIERVAAGPVGVRALIDGKFLFLIAQGAAQALLILIIAWLFFDVKILQRPFELFLAILSAAICAAGLCLALVSVCRSRGQAHAFGTAAVLMAAAVGGSMAPRFLMAPEIRAIGGLTPNAWGIDAFSAALWRGGGLDLVATPLALLLASGLFGLLATHIAAKRSLRADF